MKIDIQKFYGLVDKGYLRFQKHPTDELLIWNYTEICQFEKYWIDETLMSRGLITDFDGNIIARAFNKFFNLGELPTPSQDPETLEFIVANHGNYIIQEKYDGSLGIIFWHNNKWNIATRGSFTSEQAVEASSIVDLKGFDGQRDLTHLFEIIYPANRIVIDYNGERKLVYLASINPSDNHEYIDPYCATHFEIPNIYTAIEKERANHEGYVLSFVDGFKLKIKHDEYKRLHRLVTGLNPKSIWEILSTGGTLETIIQNVPDEFFNWAKEISDKLQKDYKHIETQCLQDFEDIESQPEVKESRKAFAIMTQLLTTKPEYQGIIFSLKDRKDYSHIIWKMLKPKGNITFKPNEE